VAGRHGPDHRRVRARDGLAHRGPLRRLARVRKPPGVVDEVLAPFGARFASGERFRPERIRSIVADGDTVIVVWDGRGVANDGRPYENSYAWVMRLRDGKVVDGTAFYDSISFNELWSRVAPA
jgi:uncharacterized protein